MFCLQTVLKLFLIAVWKIDSVREDGEEKWGGLFLNENTSSTTAAFPPRRMQWRDLKGLVGLRGEIIGLSETTFKALIKEQVIFQQQL